TKREHKVRLAAGLGGRGRINGKPRQPHVAYLANIIETEIDDTRSRCRFWEEVVRELDNLSNLVPADDRRHLEQAIGHRVPCPTRRQYDGFYRDRLAFPGPDFVP